MQMEAMQRGSRIHRKLQKKAGPLYPAEVPLKMEFTEEDYTVILEGRADGIITEEDLVTVDEIKGVFQDVNLLEQPVGVHLAQAKCYAYITALQRQLSEISVQMTYCNLDTEEIRRFREHYSFGELKEWFEALIAAYEKWADFQYRAKQERNASIAKLEFPFPWP